MRFSIIIPVFNKADTISACIECIHNQTYGDYEIIIINDGSKDNLHKVLSDYKDIVLIDKENGGVSSARNAGLERALGDYVCFLDADDLWDSAHLQILCDLIFKYPDSEMFVTAHNELRGCTTRISSDAFPESFPNEFESDNYFKVLNKYGDSIIHTNSVCIKRSLIEHYNIRFDVNSKLGEDVDFWFRAALRTRVALSKVATTSYRRDLSTATANGSFNANWKFASRKDTIVNDDTIPLSRRIEALKTIDRNRLYICRYYLKQGDKRLAESFLRQVTYKRGLKYSISYILFRLPLRFSKLIIR